MYPGLSTASFYPLETELSLIKVGELGFESTEVFFNSNSELEPEFLKKLKSHKENYGLRINSVHPMASFAETYMLFSTYKKRFYDAAEFYKKYFEAANYLGAKTVVLHGSRLPLIIPKEEYFYRYQMLSQEAQKQGINIAHENVVNTFGSSPDNMSELKKAIGEEFNMVLDIKQAVRSGYKPKDFVDRFYDNIKQVHISDHNEIYDCLPPGQGNFDFNLFMNDLNSRGYKGDYIIELYSNSYENENDLLKSKNYLKNIDVV